jgi:hypothetical protein
LGWRDDHEFKFNKLRRDITIKLIEAVVPFNFKVYALYVDKKHIALQPSSNDANTLYSKTIKELLMRMPLTNAVVRIDGRNGKAYMRSMATYYRKEINRTERRIDNVRFADSQSNSLIQLADIVVGSINRSMQTDKTDSQDYIGLLKGKIELKEDFHIN